MEKSPINRSSGVNESGGDNNENKESLERQGVIEISFKVEIKHDSFISFNLNKREGETFQDLAQKIKDAVMHAVDKFNPEKREKFEKLIGMEYGFKIHDSYNENREEKLWDVLSRNGITHYGMGGM